MTINTFLFGIAALLLAPGPTNTLMGLAGARSGMRGVVRLLPAELAGYLTTILPLVWLGQGALAEWPVAASLLKLAAAAWVLVLAARLWGAAGDPGASDLVTARRVYVTTAMNPKALVFGLVFLPGIPDPAFAARLATFSAMVVAVAILWGTAGKLVQAGGSAGRFRLIQRVASVWLAVVAVTLVAGVVSA
jgi:threonine/homoserine/homoserine lactone efflux protein